MTVSFPLISGKFIAVSCFFFLPSLITIICAMQYHQNSLKVLKSILTCFPVGVHSQWDKITIDVVIWDTVRDAFLKIA